VSSAVCRALYWADGTQSLALSRDIEKRTQLLGSSLEGCCGPAPSIPGGHQQVLLNVLAGFERTEAGVVAEVLPARDHVPHESPSGHVNYPAIHRVDELTQDVVEAPASTQGAPSFFSCTCSCSSSAMTLFFRTSFVSSVATFRSAAVPQRSEP
jgi:hypothetical protein